MARYARPENVLGKHSQPQGKSSEDGEGEGEDGAKGGDSDDGFLSSSDDDMS